MRADEASKAHLLMLMLPLLGRGRKYQAIDAPDMPDAPGPATRSELEPKRLTRQTVVPRPWFDDRNRLSAIQH